MSLNTVKDMVNWVEENMNGEPTLVKMAEYVGYSSYYCSAKFHEHVGCSFKEYVLKRKLSMATIELEETDKRIVDVAVCYGFSSHEAFTRAFVKQYGVSPKEYRSKKPNLILKEKASVQYEPLC